MKFKKGDKIIHKNQYRKAEVLSYVGNTDRYKLVFADKSGGYHDVENIDKRYVLITPLSLVLNYKGKKK